ncbi:hypothetical protein SAMN04488693_101319 [Arthrobacter subterraneus]|uniref:ISXO2-like transposase domain-containing protein n=1 Tax=Arthrobacter subterraneus TaxID=335973 RepID=A0A1G8CM90_9MICC|nr:hypothetical protein SAMN04488693_101319 [Arthrobacter subterraneus]
MIVASQLKRWMIGTMHYGASREQFAYYLDEFTVRFNRRTSKSRGLLFYRLLDQAVSTGPHPLKTLVIPENERTSAKQIPNTQIRKAGPEVLGDARSRRAYRLPVAMSSMRRSGSAAPHSS